MILLINSKVKIGLPFDFMTGFLTKERLINYVTISTYERTVLFISHVTVCVCTLFAGRIRTDIKTILINKNYVY